MPWMLKPEKIDRMTEHVRGLGWLVDEWWLDDSALAGWWDMMGYGSGRTFMVAVPAGGCVAWVARLDDVTWTLYAYSLDIGIPSGEYTDIATADRVAGKGKKLDERFITQWSMPGWVAPPAIKAVTGAWCACRESGTNSGRIGRVDEVDRDGRITRVLLSRNGYTAEASSYAKRWFVLEARDAACTARWDAGDTTFRAYIAMLSSLAREQKKLTGTSARPSKPGMAVKSPGAHVTAGRFEDEMEGIEDRTADSIREAMARNQAAGMPLESAHAAAVAEVLPLAAAAKAECRKRHGRV
jgi:hypothetical protein